VAGCSDDGGEPTSADLGVEAAPDLSTALGVSGAGGCALDGRHASPRALLLVALALLAFALRRRSA
jgi:hypothetical protein